MVGDSIKISECIDPRECGCSYRNPSVQEDWRTSSWYYPLGGFRTLHLLKGIRGEIEAAGKERRRQRGWWRWRYAWISGNLRSYFEEGMRQNIINKWILQLQPLTARSQALLALLSSLQTHPLISLQLENKTLKRVLKFNAIVPLSQVFPFEAILENRVSHVRKILILLRRERNSLIISIDLT